MDFPLLGSLAILALIDSTSFGTLLIPIWLLLHPGGIRAGRFLLFLGTVAGFYFAVGVAVAVGAGAFLPQLTRLLDTPAATWTQLCAGVALFFWSFRLGRGNGPAAGEDRMARWRQRALTGGATASLAGLALTAAAAEVTTMLPYLAAIGLLTTAHPPVVTVVAVMAGYCLLMIAPAVVLLVLRMTTERHVLPVLTWISDRLARVNVLSWIVGIVGFLLALDAVDRLPPVVTVDIGVLLALPAWLDVRGCRRDPGCRSPRRSRSSRPPRAGRPRAGRRG